MTIKPSDIPPGVRLFGDPDWRGRCPREADEQVTFFNRLRREYAETYGLLAVHPRNEQLLRGGQHRALARHRAEGMTPGACDVICPGAPTFLCEIKRQDRTKSSWQPGQIPYLSAAAGLGCFACVALGHAAAWQAFSDWVDANRSV
jgi:hypothetical protein